jgi:predicted RNase H-like HicB family nuclease
MRYLAIIEQGQNSWGAYVPDLSGCVAVARTRAGVIRRIREAVELHLDELRRAGEPLPRPCAQGVLVDADDHNEPAAEYESPPELLVEIDEAPGEP